MVFGHVVTVGRQGVALITVVLSQGLRCANGLRKVVTNSSLLSLQATLLVVNVLIFSAAKKSKKRAEFISAVQCIKDLDEQTLRLVLGYLPAWVKFPEFERARFVNDGLQLLWPALDSALSNLVKAHLEPILQANAPSVVSGCHFEGLSFGPIPIQIVGIKNSTFRTASEQLGIVLDLDLRWAGQPDITLKLLPSRRWLFKLLPQSKGFDWTPEMHIAFNSLHLAGMLRVTLTPVVQSAPFVGGMSISWLQTPMIDFDVRGLGGADLMSLPAVADWIMSSIVSAHLAHMVWPKSVSIPFAAPEESEHWRAPIGVVTVEVLDAKLPPRLGSISRKKKPLNPYAAVVIGKESDGNVQSGTTETVHDSTEPRFSEVFHLCVYDARQVLKIVMAHDMGAGIKETDLVLGRIDVPMAELVAPSQFARRSRLSGSALAGTHAHRALPKGRHLIQSPRTMQPGSSSSSQSATSAAHQRHGGSESSSPTIYNTGDTSPDSPSASNATWSLVEDGGAGLAAAEVGSEEVDGFSEPFGTTPAAPEGNGDLIVSPAAATNRDVAPSDRSVRSGGVRRSEGEMARCDTREAAAASVAQDESPRAGSNSAFRLKTRADQGRPVKQQHRNRTAHEAAIAATGPDGAWLPLLSIKSSRGALQSWGAVSAPVRPPPRSLHPPHRLPSTSAYFPRGMHLSALLGGRQPKTHPNCQPVAHPRARATLSPAPDGTATTRVTTPHDVIAGSSSQTASPSLAGQGSNFRDSRGPRGLSAAGTGHTNDTMHQAAPEAAAASSSSPRLRDLCSHGFWDWHEATSLLKHQHTRHLASVVGSSKPGGASEGGSTTGTRTPASPPTDEDTTVASIPVTPITTKRSGSSSDAVRSPSRWQWHHRRHRKAKGRKVGGAQLSSVSTSNDRSRRGSLDLLSSLLEKLHGDSSIEGEAAGKAGVAKVPTSTQADVLGICRIRLAFHAVGGPMPTVLHSAADGARGSRVGVLLVRLQSVALTSAELTLPSVLIRLGDQVRQTRNIEAVNGSHLSWDDATFAFALRIPSSGDAEQMHVQVGNLSVGLGEKLWASWFSSAAEYDRDTQPIASATISVRPAIYSGAMSGTYHVYGCGPASLSPSPPEAPVGQITLKCSWRPAQHD